MTLLYGLPAKYMISFILVGPEGYPPGSEHMGSIGGNFEPIN